VFDLLSDQLFGGAKDAAVGAAQKKLQLIDKSQDGRPEFRSSIAQALCTECLDIWRVCYDVVGCVMCQYIVERCETNVKQSGVIPGMAQVVDPATIFLETESKTGTSS